MTYADIYKTKSGTLNELRQLRASHAKKVDDDSATKLVMQGRNSACVKCIACSFACAFAANDEHSIFRVKMYQNFMLKLF